MARDPNVANLRDPAQSIGQLGAGVVDFGAAPGGFDASLVITGQQGINANAVVDAWVVATATADHSADEHWVDPPRVIAGAIVPGVGFTIYANAQSPGPAYGQWTVAWQWLN